MSENILPCRCKVWNRQGISWFMYFFSHGMYYNFNYIHNIQIIIQTDCDCIYSTQYFWRSLFYMLWVYCICLYVHLICCFLPAAYMSIFLISNTTESYLFVLWVSSYEPPLLHMTPVLFLVNKCLFPYCSIVFLYICSVICSGYIWYPILCNTENRSCAFSFEWAVYQVYSKGK